MGKVLQLTPSGPFLKCIMRSAPRRPMQEAPVVVKVAATNRYLAQFNKSRYVGGDGTERQPRLGCPELDLLATRCAASETALGIGGSCRRDCRRSHGRSSGSTRAGDAFRGSTHRPLFAVVSERCKSRAHLALQSRPHCARSIADVACRLPRSAAAVPAARTCCARLQRVLLRRLGSSDASVIDQCLGWKATTPCRRRRQKRLRACLRGRPPSVDKLVIAVGALMVGTGTAVTDRGQTKFAAR